MKNVLKAAFAIMVLAGITMACQRGPHKETWGAGKPKKNHMENKK